MILKKSEKSFVKVIVMTDDVIMRSYTSIVILLVYDLRFQCESLVWLKLKHWLKTLLVSHYQCFLVSVLILVIVDENNFSHAV